MDVFKNFQGNNKWQQAGRNAPDWYCLGYNTYGL